MSAPDNTRTIEGSGNQKELGNRVNARAGQPQTRRAPTVDDHRPDEDDYDHELYDNFGDESSNAGSQDSEQRKIEKDRQANEEVQLQHVLTQSMNTPQPDHQAEQQRKEEEQLHQALTESAAMPQPDHVLLLQEQEEDLKRALEESSKFPQPDHAEGEEQQLRRVLEESARIPQPAPHDPAKEGEDLRKALRASLVSSQAHQGSLPRRPLELVPGKCPYCERHIAERKPIKTPCGNELCSECLAFWLQNSCSCPVCGKQVRTEEVFGPAG